MKTFLQQSLLLMCVVALVGCGGGGSSGGSNPVAVTSSAPIAISSAMPSSSLASSAPISSEATSSSSASRPAGEATQTYSVTVDVPSSFALQAAAEATSTLTASHFAVIVVDIAGMILEKVQLYSGDLSMNYDGSWSVSFPGSPRLDYLIVVDINKPIELAVGSNMRQTDLLYAPITNNSIDVDIGSTAAYSNLLDQLSGTSSFAVQSFDPTATANIKFVDVMVNSIQDIVAEQTLSQFGSITNALAALKAQVADIVGQEVLNVNSAVTGTAVSLIRDEGGMFTYLSLDDGGELNINYDALIGMENVASYHFDGSTFVAVDASPKKQDLVLGSGGWVVRGNGIRVTAYNSDGSALSQWVDTDGIGIKLDAEQVFDLQGRNIQDFLDTDVDTLDAAGIVDSISTFTSGAKAYRIKISFLDTLYSLPVEAAIASDGICDVRDNNEGVPVETLGGNCNVVELWGANQQFQGNATELINLLSPDVGPDSAGFKAVTYSHSLVVQLLNDSAKTARFYQQTSITEESDTEQTLLVGTGTWAQVTLPHLEEDAFALKVQMTSPLDVNYLLPDIELFLVKQAGFIRVVQGFTDISNVELSFNGVANGNILNAINGASGTSAPPPALPQI